MTAPSAFAKRLERDFQGRLRIRWSDSSNQWLIEEKVGRASAPAHARSYDDNLTRAAQGYSLVLTVAPGDRERCRKCGSTVKLPVFDFAETKCQTCGSLTRSCFWPLTDMLLEHLRKIDPLRDGPSRLRDEADAATRKASAERERRLSGSIEDHTKDLINTFGGFTSLGYTGREAMWEHASCPPPPSMALEPPTPASL